MKISVFGLGYVGTVSAACFAGKGHSVVGVDVQPSKVERINRGESPVVEPGVDETVARVVEEGRLRATTDAVQAVAETDVSLICVGTPSRRNGSLNLDYVEKVSGQIGRALRDKADDHTVIVRSTMLPGSVEGTVIPALEKSSGKPLGQGFFVCVNPEFLREGSAESDFYHPPFTLIGESEPRAGDLAAEMYSFLDAPLFRTSIREAEMIKYVCNALHALKVAFANEIGSVAKRLGIDSHKVMEIVCTDRKLNISEKYLIPGTAYGGSCLPKDVRALLYKAREVDLDIPLLRSLPESNQRHVERTIDMVRATGKKRVGVLGLSFKAGTDDLRESPIIPIIETLVGKGYQVTVHDAEVRLSQILGTNREYLEERLPHISRLLREEWSEVVKESDVIVVNKKSDLYAELPKSVREGQMVIDLVRGFEGGAFSEGVYRGLCW
jgi:GDP-mannose 6-dehydrogenase